MKFNWEKIHGYFSAYFKLILLISDYDYRGDINLI